MAKSFGRYQVLSHDLLLLIAGVGLSLSDGRSDITTALIGYLIGGVISSCHYDHQHWKDSHIALLLLPIQLQAQRTNPCTATSERVHL